MSKEELELGLETTSNVFTWKNHTYKPEGKTTPTILCQLLFQAPHGKSLQMYLKAQALGRDGQRGRTYIEPLVDLKGSIPHSSQKLRREN